MDKRLKLLNIIITFSLALSIASSFFIIKNLHLSILKLPQLSYLFLITGITAMLVKISIYKDVRELFKKTIKYYRLYLILFLIFIFINILFWFVQYRQDTLTPLFLTDLGRVITMILMSLIIVVQLTTDNRSKYWIMIAFFIPLTITPLLLFRDMNVIMKILPSEFFTNYSIQALQYNTTSLATWLIITFAFSTSYLFKKIQSKKILHIIIFSLCTIVTTSLIWWTSSRGALLAAIIIFLIIGYRHYNKNILKLVTVVFSLFIILFSSVYILPIQARTSVFVRYYPQYRETATTNNFMVPSIKKLIAKYGNNTSQDTNTVLLQPNFTSAQDRQNFWPKHILYILNHPLGIYGPEIIHDNNSNVYQEGEHNTLLQSAKWGGWGSMLILGLFLIYIFRIVYILIKKHYNEPYTFGLTMAFFGIFILSMLNSFITLKTFWIIPAMIIAFYYEDNDHQFSL